MFFFFLFTKWLCVFASSRELPTTVYSGSYYNGIDNRVHVLHNNKEHQIQSLIKREHQKIHENNRKMDVLKLLSYETNLHKKIYIINQNYDVFPSTLSVQPVSSPNIMSNLNNDDFIFTNNKQETFLEQDFYKLYFLLH